MKLEILYKDNVIGTLSEGETATVPKGKKFTGDIVVRVVDDVSSIATFEYAQTSSWYSIPIYRDFEVGMTWAEFINSDYNAEQKTFYNEGKAYILGKFILNDDNTVSFKGNSSAQSDVLTFKVYTYEEGDSNGRNGTRTKATELISSAHPYWSMLGSGGN